MSKTILILKDGAMHRDATYDPKSPVGLYRPLIALPGEVFIADKSLWDENDTYVPVTTSDGYPSRVNKERLTELEGLGKEEIIRAVRDADIDLVVMHGAAMVMHGIKEITQDVDAYPLVKGGFDPESHKIVVGDGESMEMGVFDFGKKGYECPSVEFKMMGGVKVQTLENIIKHKEAIGRQKDLIAIEQIKQHIAKRGNENE